MDAERVYGVPSLDGSLEYHCFIAFSYEDKDVAERIANYLKSNSFKVAICLEFKLGVPLADNIERCVQRSRRVVVLLSKNYLKSNYFDHETLLFIHNNNTHKRQLLVPVCLDLTEEEAKTTRLGVYSYSYLEYKGTDIDLLRISQAVAGPDIPLKVSLPCGNVAQGLVWSYYYGYLRLIFPSLEERCEYSEYYNQEGKPFLPTLFILVPASGNCHSDISNCDPRIQKMAPLAAAKVNRAGVIARNYNNYIYSVKDNKGKEYYALLEYATPVVSMYEMSREGLAGLSKDEMMHQVRNFKDLLDQVLSHSPLSRSLYMFRLVFFETDADGRADLSSTIINQIEVIRKDKQLAKEQSLQQLQTLQVREIKEN